MPHSRTSDIDSRVHDISSEVQKLVGCFLSYSTVGYSAPTLGDSNDATLETSIGKETEYTSLKIKGNTTVEVFIQYLQV